MENTLFKLTGNSILFCPGGEGKALVLEFVLTFQRGRARHLPGVGCVNAPPTPSPCSLSLGSHFSSIIGFNCLGDENIHNSVKKPSTVFARSDAALV